MRRWKRVLSIALVSVLTMGLCACNKESGGLGIGGKEQVKADANSALAKEYVYSMEEYDFGEVTADKEDYSVVRMEKIDDRIYAVLRTYDQEGKTGYQMLSMNTDGSDMTSVDLPLTMSGDDSQDAGDETSATKEKVTAEVDDAGIDMDMSLDEDFYAGYVYEDTSCGTFLIMDDYICANKTYYYEDYSDPDNYVSVRKDYLCRWDLEGNLIHEIPLEALSGDENTWFYVNTLVPLNHGKVALLISGSENGKIVVDSEGNVSELSPVEKLEDYFANGSYTAMMPDGNFLFTYYNDDWSKLYQVTYDFEKDTATAPFPIPSTIVYNGLGNLSIDANGDLMYCNSQGVFKYHLGDQEAQQVMSFVNSDLNISYLDAILPLDSKSFVGIYSEYDSVTSKRTLEGGVFTKVNPEDIPDKEVLVLGGNYISGDIKNRVIDFNKSSDTHRIILKDYSQYNSNDDYMAGYTQLNNDIISGNMPDILVVDNYNMSVENFATKGLLANIDELIANDEELGNVEYMDNVFEACRIDGKLYEIIPSFNVSTYVGKTSIVGDRTGWTMQEAQALVKDMPEGTSLFGDMTRPMFFNLVMEMCGRDFVDVSTGKCSFDSDAFISLMEFAMTLPTELGDDYYGDDWYSLYETQYRDNRTILANCYISNMDNMVYTINGNFGEDISYVGMPTSSGQGSIIYTYDSYAISANSDYVDVAWDFMRYYLTDEYQDTLSWQLPVGKKQFDAMLQKATKNPVYTDEQGMEVESEYTYWINGESIVINPLTQTQVDKLSDFISSVTTRAYYNTEISNIITEEMEAFYQGQKNAKEVAGIIQSRVQLYVNENR